MQLHVFFDKRKIDYFNYICVHTVKIWPYNGLEEIPMNQKPELQLFSISKIKWYTSKTDYYQSASNFKSLVFFIGGKWAVEMLTRYTACIHYILLA